MNSASILKQPMKVNSAKKKHSSAQTSRRMGRFEVVLEAVFAVVFAEVLRFAGVFFFPVLAAIGFLHLKE